MAWNLTLLFVHLAAMIGLIAMYPTAPCWMQKVVVGLLIAVMAIASIAYTAAMFLGWEPWTILIVALAIEHIAVLLYVFRLIFQGALSWQKSSAASLSLPH